MPLIQGKSDKTRQENIKKEIAAGKPVKQAVAIGYAKQREAKSKDDDDILEFDETTESWISKKIKELIDEGYEPKQAQAIAYAEHRRNAKKDSKDDDKGKTFKIYDSARNYDLNGWPEIKDNPISKVGVFPYLGRDISPDLEPDVIYNVYRPEEELSSPETIESFKLLPWTDEHAMLGSQESGLLPAEKKGIHGVIGEDVFFEDGYLKGNIKIFSDKLADLIKKGKKELSIGYRCLYDLVSGVYNGIKYDAIQREIRGNHLALVDEGRSGHDVAVLDSKGIKMPDIKRDKRMEDEEMSPEECMMMLKKILPRLNAMMKEEDESKEIKEELSEKAAHEGDEEPKEFVKRADIEDEEEKEDEEYIEDEEMSSREAEELSQEDEYEDKPGDMSKPKDKKMKDKKGMDSMIKSMYQRIDRLVNRTSKDVLTEIAKRDVLANKLSEHVGTFDHSMKTYKEVAQYGIKKLGLKCQAGHEISMLEGFLSAARRATPVMQAKDENVKSSCIDAYLNGGE